MQIIKDLIQANEFATTDGVRYFVNNTLKNAMAEILILKSEVEDLKRNVIHYKKVGMNIDSLIKGNIS